MFMNWITLVYILISLVLFYIVGTLLLWLVRVRSNDDVFYETFVRLIVGLVAVVTSYAIIKSGGNTILWGFVIVGTLYLLHKYRIKSLNIKYSIKNVFPNRIKDYMPVCVMLLFGIVFFLFQGAFFYATPINNMPHSDYAYYATLSSVLNNFGVETSDWQSVVINGSTAPSPYHYFDIWLPVIFINTLGGDTYESFVVVTQSVYMVILTVGMIALTRRFTTNKIMQVLSVLSIFFAGILFVRIHPKASDFIFSNSCSLKYLSVSLFVLWVVHIMVEKKGNWYLPMLCLPVVNVITAPVTFTTIVLLLFISAFRRRQLKSIRFQSFSVFIVAAFIVLFYFLQAGEAASGGLSFSTILNSFVDDKLKLFKIILGTIAIMFSLYFYYLLPAVGVAISSRRKDYLFLLKENAIIFVSMLIVVCMGLVVWGLAHIMVNSIQFFIVLAIPWINISLWMLILFACNVSVKEFRYFVMAFVLLIAALNIYQIDKVPFYRYSKGVSDVDYVKNVSAAISETDGLHLGVFIQDSSEMKDYWDFNCFSIGSLFKHYTSELYLTAVYPEPNIGKYADVIKPRIRKSVKGNPFQNFMVEHKLNNPDSQYEDIVLDFIKAYNCKFVYHTRHCRVPDNILPYVDKQFVNAKTGGTFVILKDLN